MTGPRRVRTRTQPCTAEEAAKRLRDAREFRQIADVAEHPGVASANAVLAGMAAADAACCLALGERSRGDDHRDAVALVTQVHPGGREAGQALRRLLAIRNDAEYGLRPLSASSRESALRQASKLVEFAAAVLAR